MRWFALAIVLVLQHEVASFMSAFGRLGGTPGFSVTSGQPRSSKLRMGIYEDITVEMKTAMKSGDKQRLSALRNIRAAFLTETKAAGSGDSLPDEACMKILRKLSKMRCESIEMYKKGGRDELVITETTELELIDSFLPKLADEETTLGWVNDAVEAAGAKGPADMGKVMGQLMKAHKAEMDGKLAQRLVTEKLKAM